MTYQRFTRLGGAVAFALFAATPAFAQQTLEFERTQSDALKWELGYLALSAVDTIQTVECVGSGYCEEANPLFGRHPSGKKIILAKVGGSLVHFALFSALNRRNPKAALRLAQISVGVQGTVVGLNARFMFR